MEKSKVLFTKECSSDAVLRLYNTIGKKLDGKVAFKLHSGEEGNQNYCKPEFWMPVIKAVGGTVVECNTAYPGSRNSTEKHRKLIHYHKWDEFFDVDIMDAEGPDAELVVPKGKILKTNMVGKNLLNYDSMLVLSHFKGHPMAGYGGALKQLSIGCASSKGKSLIHSAGYTDDQEQIWGEHHASPEDFGRCMAEAAGSVVNHFKGNIVYINAMINLSVDCDCCGVAEDPCMKDIGILASLDPVAIDRACMDLIYASKDPGRDHFVERVESRQGLHIMNFADEMGFGTKNYELVMC